jgi:hypothetical protein
VSQFLKLIAAQTADFERCLLIYWQEIWWHFQLKLFMGWVQMRVTRMAVARIYLVKGRPADHPLIVHVASMDALGDWAADVPGYAISLARDFWPGPMTLIMKRSALAGDFVTGGQDTVGVRVPDHPVALGLLAEPLRGLVARELLRRVRIDLEMSHQRLRKLWQMS